MSSRKDSQLWTTLRSKRSRREWDRRSIVPRRRNNAKSSHIECLQATVQFDGMGSVRQLYDHRGNGYITHCHRSRSHPAPPWECRANRIQQSTRSGFFAHVNVLPQISPLDCSTALYRALEFKTQTGRHIDCAHLHIELRLLQKQCPKGY